METKNKKKNKNMYKSKKAPLREGPNYVKKYASSLATLLFYYSANGRSGFILSFEEDVQDKGKGIEIFNI